MSFLLIFPLGALVAAGVLWGASALLDDAGDRSPAPVRGLMAPTGTAVFLPEFVTTRDGDVRPRWLRESESTTARQQERRAA